MGEQCRLSFSFPNCLQSSILFDDKYLLDVINVLPEGSQTTLSRQQYQRLDSAAARWLPEDRRGVSMRRLASLIGYTSGCLSAVGTHCYASHLAQYPDPRDTPLERGRAHQRRGIAIVKLTASRAVCSTAGSLELR